ncbi:LysE family translocator [uncultured Desulfuromusa sp.]|uniref:LysE family translocator n=1 Tax=uncultured Desulfuromusa sp. TaxID=219183 RepID=UPI002AA70417|nr:LysE family translocator [uncultured Desulfuromusa sp.]
MSLFLAMCLFALSMSISPGPVNLICLSTGVNYGLRRALPFVSGATIGFSLLLALVGLGIGVLAEHQQLLDLLGFAGAGFIGYIGVKIAISDPILKPVRATQPGFGQGFLLQWLNPKAWIACLSGVSAFNLAGDYPLLTLFVAIYFFICYASIASWALVGVRLGRWIVTPSKLQIFNRLMGGALVTVSVYLLILQLAMA